MDMLLLFFFIIKQEYGFAKRGKVLFFCGERKMCY